MYIILLYTKYVIETNETKNTYWIKLHKRNNLTKCKMYYTINVMKLKLILNNSIKSHLFLNCFIKEDTFQN